MNSINSFVSLLTDTVFLIFVDVYACNHTYMHPCLTELLSGASSSCALLCTGTRHGFGTFSRSFALIVSERHMRIYVL